MSEEKQEERQKEQKETPETKVRKKYEKPQLTKYKPLREITMSPRLWNPDGCGTCI